MSPRSGIGRSGLLADKCLLDTEEEGKHLDDLWEDLDDLRDVR